MRIFSSFILCVLLVGVPAGAQTPAGKVWKPLFNGRNLHGWKAYGQEKWTVKKGEIVGESAADRYGYLVTNKTYRNFEARLKFKAAGGNSGFFYHSRITGINPEHGPDIVGPQVEIDPQRDTGGIYESGERGWVARETATSASAIKSNQWNEIEVRVEGNRTVTRLNGTEIVDFTDPTPKFTDGHIALQLHTGGGVKIRFKDLYIRKISK